MIKRLGSDEDVKEMNSKGTKASKVPKDKLSGGEQTSKKIKIDFGKYGMSVDNVEKSLTVQGNLKTLLEFYEKFDHVGKRTLEESTVKYLNIFDTALVEIMFEIPRSLYDILEMRRSSAKEEDERLKEYLIVNLCMVIVVEEVDIILKEVGKVFRRKPRINKVIIG